LQIILWHKKTLNNKLIIVVSYGCTWQNFVQWFHFLEFWCFIWSCLAFTLNHFEHFHQLFFLEIRNSFRGFFYVALKHHNDHHPTWALANNRVTKRRTFWRFFVLKEAQQRIVPFFLSSDSATFFFHFLAKNKSWQKRKGFLQHSFSKFFFLRGDN